MSAFTLSSVAALGSVKVRVAPAPLAAPKTAPARSRRDLGAISVAGMWKDPDPPEEEMSEEDQLAAAAA